LKKTKKDEPSEPDNKVISFNHVLKHRQNESLERLAFAAEAKANATKEQYMFNFHMKNPASAASIAWFTTKELEYAPAVPMAMATTGTSCDDDVDPIVPDVINVDAEDPADDADDDKESEIDEDGLFIPAGGYVRDVALDNIIAAHNPGPPNAIGLDQTTDTTSDDSQEDSEWDTLPPTQRLVSSFNNATVDSQATTLTN
jgi:hypothetical protein